MKSCLVEGSLFHPLDIMALLTSPIKTTDQKEWFNKALLTDRHAANNPWSQAPISGGGSFDGLLKSCWIEPLFLEGVR